MEAENRENTREENSVTENPVDINSDKEGPAETKSGKIYLVGAGPGDPSLITLRGKAVLEKAEVVVYDYLANKKLLKHVPKDAEFIYAGKKGHVKHTHTQEEINQMLIDHALAGRTVVRLKGGDPFIFGRGGEEIEELVKADIPFEVVPGVTAATAAATYAGIPITHRKYTASVTFLTGHEDPDKPTSNVAWDKIATGAGTLVFYMGIKNLDHIVEKLIDNGRDPKTPVAVVRWASTPRQRTVVGPLEKISSYVKKARIKPPAIVLVGDVVRLRKKINWYENRSLFGKRILITRTRDQASELVAQLEELGADCREWATIAIKPPESWDELDRELKHLKQYKWVLFTSTNGVKFFFSRLFELGMDSRAFKTSRIGAVGTATADELIKFGIKADLLPKKFTGEALAKKLAAKGVKGDKILIPRAVAGGEALPETLSKAGAQVTIVPVYRNMRPKEGEKSLRMEFEKKNIDIVTFTSSSTVTNFLHMIGIEDPDELKKLLDGVTIASIGPITTKTAEQSGLKVHIQPKAHTIPALVESIEAYVIQEGSEAAE
ncbi:MAG: uroporphyrinogen-III C-methyltransferase [Desulfobulbaceae bacterium]|nr:uroporphyrinogen-III C-methyltransferase [Desulfobulbaceae bacterium]MCK5543918.1 uroporphyrinogen-III C-methyltransferase [Desulfobulbaceae bacterium]